MTRHELLASMIRQVQTDVPDVQAAVLASRDGLALVSTLDGAESDRIAAMAATVNAVGARVTTTAELGDLQEVVVRSEAMTFVVYDAGDAAVLALMADGACNLGLVHLEGRRTAAALADVLANRANANQSMRGDHETPMPPPPPPPTDRGDDDADQTMNGSDDHHDADEHVPA